MFSRACDSASGLTSNRQVKVQLQQFPLLNGSESCSQFVQLTGLLLSSKVTLV